MHRQVGPLQAESGLIVLLQDLHQCNAGGGEQLHSSSREACADDVHKHCCLEPACLRQVHEQREVGHESQGHVPHMWWKGGFVSQETRCLALLHRPVVHELVWYTLGVHGALQLLRDAEVSIWPTKGRLGTSGGLHVEATVHCLGVRDRGLCGDNWAGGDHLGAPSEAHARHRGALHCRVARCAGADSKCIWAPRSKSLPAP
mmetsp:Transcript_52840/g.119025  ORF Transcript_52840/g.119025 Transcript_52840/m.119025 type:complete len:202 (+) Transcript_52840:630-1235(+)